MGCHYCSTEGLVAISAHGACSTCNMLVCADPSGRGDHVFHGEKCSCGCGKFFCDLDLRAHATVTEGSRPSRCFPNIVQLLGLDALGESDAALAEADKVVGREVRVTETQAGVFSRYLTLTPGGAELERERLTDDVGAMKTAGVEFKRPTAVQMSPRAMFPASFFGRAAVERVLTLSARSVTEVAMTRGQVTHWPTTSPDDTVLALAELLNHALRFPPRLTTDASSARLPDAVIKALARPGSLERIRTVLAKELANMPADSLAKWFLDSGSSQT